MRSFLSFFLVLQLVISSMAWAAKDGIEMEGEEASATVPRRAPSAAASSSADLEGSEGGGTSVQREVLSERILLVPYECTSTVTTYVYAYQQVEHSTCQYTLPLKVQAFLLPPEGRLRGHVYTQVRVGPLQDVTVQAPPLVGPPDRSAGLYLWLEYAENMRLQQIYQASKLDIEARAKEQYDRHTTEHNRDMFLTFLPYKERPHHMGEPRPFSDPAFGCYVVEDTSARMSGYTSYEWAHRLAMTGEELSQQVSETRKSMEDELRSAYEERLAPEIPPEPETDDLGRALALMLAILPDLPEQN